MHCPNKCKTQRLCSEAVDKFLVAYKLVSHWFVTSKMLKKFNSALDTNYDYCFYIEDFDKVSFIANGRKC